jgi:hypothetical protein
MDFQTVAGIYTIVRGSDNFAHSEPFASGGPAFKTLWTRMRNMSWMILSRAAFGHLVARI